MTLIRCSWICSLIAVLFIICQIVYPLPWIDNLSGFYLPLTGAVVFASLGAFVFRNY